MPLAVAYRIKTKGIAKWNSAVKRAKRNVNSIRTDLKSENLNSLNPFENKLKNIYTVKKQNV